MKFDDRLAEHRESLAGDFVPAVEAAGFVEWMASEHPDELAEWMRSKAVYFATRELGDMLRSERSRAARRAGSRAFGVAVSSGDDEALSVFRSVCVVDESNTRRAVGDMTGADHRFVAGQYEANGNRVLSLAAFHRAVAKRVGRKRTAEVIDEATYERLRSSFLAGEAA